MGALILLSALGPLVIQLRVSIRERHRNRVTAGDPWDARTLEWSTSAPPPEYDYAIIPAVDGRDAFIAAKRRGTAYDTASYVNIELPRNSAAGMAIGVAAGAAAFGLVWRIGWLVLSRCCA